MTLKFNGWPWKTIGHLLYATSSFVHYFKAISELKLELLEMPISGQNWHFFKIGWMTLKNNRAPILCHFNLCASFHSNWCIQTGVTIQKRSILGQNRRIFFPCDLEIWWITLKNNRAPFVHYFKLFASFCRHQSIQNGVGVWKRPIQVKISNSFCPMWPWNLVDDLEKQ